MKKLLFIGFLFCFAFTTKAQNLIYNGSFEQNNINGNDCREEIDNVTYSSLMHHSTASSIYRNLENGIFFRSCITYDSTIVSDDIAHEGSYAIRVILIDTIVNNFHYEKYTSLSLSLSTNLQINAYYKLSYHQKILPHIYPNNFIAGQVVIGISDSATAFGTTIDTMPYPTTNWTKVELTFQATIPAQHLTIKAALEQGYHGVLVDDFVLKLDSLPPNAIYEQEGKKQLLKVVDILGRESKLTATGLLFYIYSDGTVEKRIILE